MSEEEKKKAALEEEKKVAETEENTESKNTESEVSYLLFNLCVTSVIKKWFYLMTLNTFLFTVIFHWNTWVTVLNNKEMVLFNDTLNTFLFTAIFHWNNCVTMLNLL